MNAALPLPTAAPALANPAAPATVLPAALLAALAVPAGAPGLPSFERTLQQLLQEGAALPQAGLPQAALLPDGTAAQVDMQTEAETDTEAGDATALSGAPASLAPPFDPALASLQPPPQAAMLQGLSAAVATRVGDAAAVAAATPLPTAAVPTQSAQPALLPQAQQAALAALQPQNMPGTAAAPAPAAQSTPVAAAAAALFGSGDAGADKPAPAVGQTPAPTLPGAATATATAASAEAAAPSRSGEAAAQGRTPSLLQTLGERIALQVERGSERVVIRLDPPHRGQIEILIRQDASGATTVQLHASHGDVVRQLHAIGDSLRQDLAQRQGGDVSVHVAQQSREQDGRQRQDRQNEDRQQPGRALADETDPRAERFALASDRP